MAKGKTEQRDWYDTPEYYDIIFDADTAREADFMEAVWERFNRVPTPKHRRRVLEPACGSGRLVLEMARRGWQVDGFDLSEEMLRFARQRMAVAGLKARLWVDDMAGFTAPAQGQYHLSHCLVSTFKYLLTEADAQGNLRRVQDALMPGGLHILGVHLTDYSRTVCEHERWVESRGDVAVVCNTRGWPADKKTRLEPVRTRLKISRGAETHTQETRWFFRTYSAAQLRRTLREAAPELEVAACFDFTYDIEAPRGFDDEYSDLLLVLRRR